MRHVTIYTDGATKNVTECGGWAARLEFAKPDGTLHVLELWGALPSVTVNQMELMAMVEGLAALKQQCQVTLVTDSQCASIWMHKRPPRDNTFACELHTRAQSLLRHHRVTIQLIKGHNGHWGNGRADQIAFAAARGLPIPEPKEHYGTKHKPGETRTAVRLERASEGRAAQALAEDGLRSGADPGSNTASGGTDLGGLGNVPAGSMGASV